MTKKYSVSSSSLSNVCDECKNRTSSHVNGHWRSKVIDEKKEIEKKSSGAADKQVADKRYGRIYIGKAVEYHKWMEGQTPGVMRSNKREESKSVAEGRLFPASTKEFLDEEKQKDDLGIVDFGTCTSDGERSRRVSGFDSNSNSTSNSKIERPENGSKNLVGKNKSGPTPTEPNVFRTSRESKSRSVSASSEEFFQYDEMVSKQNNKLSKC